MSDYQVEVLTPLNAAALWPQLRRLGTEVVATRSAENRLLSAGIAAMGVGNLPRFPRSIVIGARQGLSYSGVLVARQLDGGAAWEAVSLRLVREKDDAAVEALLQTVAGQVALRGGRTLFLRSAEGSPHAGAIRRGGLRAYSRERLYAPPEGQPPQCATEFRPSSRSERVAIFRLYCQTIPEVIRRNEAITQHEFRAVLDLYDCASEYVLDGSDGLVAWASFGAHEARLMDASADGHGAALALDLIGTRLTPSGTLVLGEHQETEQRLATERGFTPLGTREVNARRLAALNPLKEALAVPATSRVPN